MYIFWDFNGTILDDAGLCYDILSEMLIEEERPSVTFEEYLMIFDFPVESYYAKVYDLNKTDFKTLAHRFINRYQPRSLDLKLHDHVIEAIHHFESLGHTNILLSASEKKNLDVQMKHYGIEHLFKDVLSTSDVYGRSKLDVAKRYVESTGIDPKSCVMIGDTLHDAEVAESLGFRIIIYTKGHQHPSRLDAYETIDDFYDLYDKIR